MWITDSIEWDKVLYTTKIVGRSGKYANRRIHPQFGYEKAVVTTKEVSHRTRQESCGDARTRQLSFHVSDEGVEGNR